MRAPLPLLLQVAGGLQGGAGPDPAPPAARLSLHAASGESGCF